MLFFLRQNDKIWIKLTFAIEIAIVIDFLYLQKLKQNKYEKSNCYSNACVCWIC